MPSIEIRRFAEGDGPAVRRVHERAMRDAGDYVEGVPEPDLDDVSGHYLDGSGEFLVADAGDRIVGTIAAHPASEWLLADRVAVEEGTAELTRMRVAPAFQRQGIGWELYEALESWARTAGYDRFVLDVSVDNEPARAFYEAIGFDYVDAVTLEAAGETFPLAVYEREL